MGPCDGVGDVAKKEVSSVDIALSSKNALNASSVDDSTLGVLETPSPPADCPLGTTSTGSTVSAGTTRLKEPTSWYDTKYPFASTSLNALSDRSGNTCIGFDLSSPLLPSLVAIANMPSETAGLFASQELSPKPDANTTTVLPSSGNNPFARLSNGGKELDNSNLTNTCSEEIPTASRFSFPPVSAPSGHPLFPGSRTTAPAFGATTASNNGNSSLGAFPPDNHAGNCHGACRTPQCFLVPFLPVMLPAIPTNSCACGGFNAPTHPWPLGVPYNNLNTPMGQQTHCSCCCRGNNAGPNPELNSRTSAFSNAHTPFPSSPTPEACPFPPNILMSISTLLAGGGMSAEELRWKYHQLAAERARRNE